MGQSDCPEILSGWFQWALRDAVRQAGHYTSAREAFRFYDRLAREIDAVCLTGEVACRAPRASLAPPLRRQDVSDALLSAVELLPILLHLGGDQVGTAPSVGTAADLAWFNGLVGPVAHAPATLAEFSGQISSGRVRLEPSANAPRIWSTTLTEDAASGAFTIATDCPLEFCSLVVSLGGRDAFELPLTQLAPRVDRDGVVLKFDRIWQISSGREAWLRDRVIGTIARGIGWVYTLVGPPSVVMGTLGLFLTAALRPRAMRSPLFAIVAASLVPVVCRVALLAYVDVTGFPSVNLLYLSPAIPFAVVVAIGGLSLLLSPRCG